MKDNKTIGITIRYFTNGLAEKQGTDLNLIPCWDNGFVTLEANKTKGIKPLQERFTSTDELVVKIKKLLHRAKICRNVEK